MTNKVKFTLTRLPIDRCVNNEGQIPEVPANPRTLGKKEFERLKKKLRELDFTAARPLIAYPQGGQYVVFCGNQRLRALREIGETEINAAIVPEDMSAEELRKILLADNVSDGEWDTDMFANEEFPAEEAEWAGVEEAIWNTEGVEKKEAQEDDFDEGKDKVDTVCKKGDIWLLGQHRLMCGDSTDPEQVKTLLDGDKPDMVLSDPPYGMHLDADFSGIKGSLKSVGRKNGTQGNKYEAVIGDNDDFKPELITTFFDNFDCKECFLFGADYFAELLPHKNEGSWLVWDKRKPSQADAIGSEFELIWSKAKHKRRVLRHDWFGFLSSQNGSDARHRVHPTQKPITLLADIINQWGGKAQSIADLYGGSGSTLIACEQLNRKCYMMELDPHYCDIIIARWEKLTGQKACKL